MRNGQRSSRSAKKEVGTGTGKPSGLILNRDVGTANYSANVPPHGLSSSSCLPCPHWTPNTFVPDGYFEESASSTSWMVPLKSYPTVNGNGMAHPAPFK